MTDSNVIQFVPGLKPKVELLLGERHIKVFENGRIEGADPSKKCVLINRFGSDTSPSEYSAPDDCA